MDSSSKDARRKNLSMGVPLYNATLSGDWETANRIITRDPTLLTASISIGGLSVLHLAAGTDCAHFVDRLVAKMSEEDLELRDEKGNTAMCFAAATGTVQIAEILLRKNPNLAAMRGGQGMTPLYMAALFGKREMAWFLYKSIGESCDDGDRRGIFFSCIYTGIYDLAYKMVNNDTKLAFARDKDNKTALHLLAEAPEAFVNRNSEGYWSKLLKSFVKYKRKRNNLKKNQALELVKFIWYEALMLGHDEAMSLIRTPELLLEATKVGNFDLISVLVKSYPDLAWEHDAENRTIIHYAVMYRRVDIYNIFHDIRPIKEVLATYEDSEKNNLLHFAAKLPPFERLNTVSGAVSQLQQELLWFEEVKKIVPPLYEKKENSSKDVPEQLFSIEHKPLHEEAKTLTKKTSISGMLVSTLIATFTLAAAFILPSDNSYSSVPNDIRALSFIVFLLFNSLSFISSLVSIILFLCLLTSRYALSDFKNRLPLKLMIGLDSLFFSLMSMVVAFGSLICIAFEYRMRSVPFFFFVFAFVPIVLSALLQFPILFDTFTSTYSSRSLKFQSYRRELY